MSAFDSKRTENGFRVGPLEVLAVASDERYGVWVEVRTPRESIVVRSTRTGFLRPGKVEKREASK